MKPLNQYTQRTVPGALWVQGDAAVAAGVKINGVAANRHGTFYSTDLTVDNTTNAVYPAVAITGIGTNGATVVTNTVNGHLFAPQTPEALAYDADGNLTSDGRWTYTWDAENRLISQQSATPIVPAVRLTFTYDSNSRRVRKQLYTWSTATANWSLLTDIFFAYDNWNLIHEERRPDAYYRNVNMDYVWGLDLSGSPQGAGGIGGLLFSSQGRDGSPSRPSFYTYDANGNVTTLINATNGTVAASYLFDPFGNTLAATGIAARDNPFRFSTKYTDDETGLLYYGFRFYSPTLGRWINRDPKEESKGRNINCFVFNSPVDAVDYLGQFTISQNQMVSGKCGKFDSAVVFQGVADGEWVIQAVSRTVNIKKTPTSVDANLRPIGNCCEAANQNFYDPQPFFEAMKKNPGQALIDHQDGFNAGMYSVQNGVGDHKKWAVLFGAMQETTDHCPLGFVKGGDGAPISGCWWNAQNGSKPTGWDARASTPGYFVKYAYKATWTCCCGNMGTTSVTSYTP